MVAIAVGCYGGHRTVGVDMARTGTVPKVADRIETGWILPFRMRVGLISIGMAACAIRLIRGVRPGGGLAVAGMAAQAGQTGSMVPGIIWRRMVIAGKRPAGGRMTGIAFHCSHEMSGRFSGCLDAVVTA